MPKSALISIVDDDESVREATMGLVSSLGYVAATFASAEEFLDSEHRHDTSCIIADVHMPRLSGVDMQSHLVAEGHRLPMIFVTAFPDESLRARALAAGAFGFLSKPFNEEHRVPRSGSEELQCGKRGVNLHRPVLVNVSRHYT